MRKYTLIVRKKLIVYYIGKLYEYIDIIKILKPRLPAYMLPSMIINIPNFCYNNGKFDIILKH